MKTKFIIDDADPESRVPSPEEALKAPLQMGYWVMLVSERADAASKRGDLTAAVKYYRAIAKAVPDRAAAFTRICSTYESMGDWKHAVESCELALMKAGVTVADYVHLFRLLLSKTEPLLPAEAADAEAVIAHLQQELAKAPDPGDGSAAAAAAARPQHPIALVERLRCELGIRLEDRKRLETCTSALLSLAPNDPDTAAFAFALALMKQDFGQAERLIDKAKRSGVNEEGVALMRSKLQAELERRPFVKRMFGDVRGVVLVAGLLALFGAIALIARRKFGLRTA